MVGGAGGVGGEVHSHVEKSLDLLRAGVATGIGNDERATRGGLGWGWKIRNNKVNEEIVVNDGSLGLRSSVESICGRRERDIKRFIRLPQRVSINFNDDGLACFTRIENKRSVGRNVVAAGVG